MTIEMVFGTEGETHITRHRGGSVESKTVVTPVVGVPDLIHGYNSHIYRVKKMVEGEKTRTSYLLEARSRETEALAGDVEPGSCRPIVIEVTGVETYSIKNEKGKDEERYRLISPTNPADILGIKPEALDERVVRLIKKDMDREKGRV